MNGPRKLNFRRGRFHVVVSAPAAGLGPCGLTGADRSHVLNQLEIL